jgi:hypothetical protein
MKINILAPVYTQEDLAIMLIFSGSTLFLAGLIQGLTVGLSRYPQVAVYRPTTPPAPSLTVVTPTLKP